jgi:hypothetical protein
MVAVELLRAVSNWNDLGYGNFSLDFIRNKEKQKVDFLIADGRKAMLLIETKLSEIKASADLIKFQQYLKVPTA